MITGAIGPVWHLWREAYFAWALREIDPMHPDVNMLVLAHNDAQRQVASSGAALRVKAALRPFGKALQRIARAAWRWC